MPPKGREIRITTDTVRDWAYGIVAEWWPGYTDVLGDGMQRKLTLDATNEDSLVVGVQSMGSHGGRGPTKYYEIKLEVTETSDPREST
jgi:hypothetical protein